MSAALSSRPGTLLLILDMVDSFAAMRGIYGKIPRPIGKVRPFLVARTDPATQAPAALKEPVEMQVTPNGSGFLLFFGNIITPEGLVQRIGIEGWPWTIRINGEFYQTKDLTPKASEAGGTPVRIDLLPGPAYPFPDDPTGQAAVLLRGTLRNADGSGFAGVTVEALDSKNNALPGALSATTGADGQWVLALPGLPKGGTVNVRFTLADKTTLPDETRVAVLAGRDNNLKQTALRGQVRQGNKGVSSAAVSVDKPALRTVTDADGNWLLFFGMGQKKQDVEVVATLPDQSATKSATVTLQPRDTAVVPSFDF